MNAGSAPGLLRAARLGVTYGRLVALHEVTFALAPGAMLAVTGPSGAGKSSLLWALAGATPATGLVQLGGVPIRDRADAITRGVALVPQGNGLTSFLIAAENVLIPLLALGVSPVEARRRATAALAAVGLEESAAHLVEELSGGQQQRVALARSLAQEPAVLLADEPTSDLDASNRQRVIAAMRHLAAASTIVVMATHDPEAADQLDAELGLDDGGMTWKRRPGSADPTGRRPRD